MQGTDGPLSFCRHSRLLAAQAGCVLRASSKSKRDVGCGLAFGVKPREPEAGSTIDGHAEQHEVEMSMEAGASLIV